MIHRYRLALLVLIAVIIVLGVLICRWWPSSGPLAAAAPAVLLVDALTVPSGVLVSWSSPQARALVFRLRPGESKLFLGQYTGLGLLDCGGRSGDSYVVQAWDAEGVSLVAEGRSEEARWRMAFPVAGR